MKYLITILIISIFSIKSIYAHKVSTDSSKNYLEVIEYVRINIFSIKKGEIYCKSYRLKLNDTAFEITFRNYDSIASTSEIISKTNRYKVKSFLNLYNLMTKKKFYDAELSANYVIDSAWKSYGNTKFTISAMSENIKDVKTFNFMNNRKNSMYNSCILRHGPLSYIRINRLVKKAIKESDLIFEN